METLTYPNNLGSATGGEGHWVLFNSFPSLFMSSSNQIEYSIALPMSAQSLISTAEAIYAEQEGLGTVITDAARKAAVGLGYFQKSGGDMSEVAVAAWKNLNWSDVKDKGEASAEFMLASTIRKTDLAKRVLAGANLAVNPKMSLLYQGPGKFRKFTFEFPMIAEEPNDSAKIRDIIRRFRSSTLPGYKQLIGDKKSGSGGSTKERGAGTNFFTFPSTWDITFGHSKTGKIGTPFKIARCVCNSIITNYAAAGQPFFFDDSESSPFEVKMTITFTETSIITRDLVEQGF